MQVSEETNQKGDHSRHHSREDGDRRPQHTVARATPAMSDSTTTAWARQRLRANARTIEFSGGLHERVRARSTGRAHRTDRAESAIDDVIGTTSEHTYHNGRTCPSTRRRRSSTRGCIYHHHMLFAMALVAHRSCWGTAAPRQTHVAGAPRRDGATHYDDGPRRTIYDTTDLHRPRTHSRRTNPHSQFGSHGRRAQAAVEPILPRHDAGVVQHDLLSNCSSSVRREGSRDPSTYESRWDGNGDPLADGNAGTESSSRMSLTRSSSIGIMGGGRSASSASSQMQLGQLTIATRGRPSEILPGCPTAGHHTTTTPTTATHHDTPNANTTTATTSARIDIFTSHTGSAVTRDTTTPMYDANDKAA